jgi:FAD/FMN-containing dehydrogenase
VITRRHMLGTLAAAGLTTAAAKAIAAGAGTQALDGKIFYPGDARYEPYRQAASFNARKPNRFPKAIVLAEGEADVVAAVRLAKERGWQVTARSGGHSWSASHTRDNSVQINLSRMKQVDIDPKTRIARVSPSIYGNVLNKQLREEFSLFTPSAHGVNVGMGGFVMCGGHGWNSRVFGLGCVNLEALDVVTADGDLIHASEKENGDFYWAARGSGPAFFGVATRYYMRLHPKPPVMKSSGYIYAMSELEPVITWMRGALPSMPRYLEVVTIANALDGTTTFSLIGNCLGDTEQQVVDALAILQTCPVADKAIRKWVNKDIVVPYDVEPETDSNPTGARYAVDNIWTNASADQMLPRLRELFSSFPTPKSYAFIHWWGPVERLPDMAYSVHADVYISSNAVYYDPSDDARCQAWAVDAMKKFDGISAGAQMNDENTEYHMARYLSPEATRRLDAMRKKYDPQGRFPGLLKGI